MSAPAPASPKSPKLTPPSPKADAKSPLKRAAEEPAEEQSSAKKAKIDSPDYLLNINKAVDKEHEGKTFRELIKLPPSALQGLAGHADKMLAHFKINTIEDLGKWRFFQIARAINTLAATEQKDKRPAGSRLNINKALDQAHEKKSFAQLLKEPVSALEGLAEWADSTLKPLGAAKISQLATWKYCLWAEAMTQLAQYETEDMSS